MPRIHNEPTDVNLGAGWPWRASPRPGTCKEF
jgi:hypothetical protein